MEEWDEMDQYVSCLDDGSDPNVRMSTHSATGSGSGSSDGAFFRAVLCVRRQKVSVHGNSLSSKFMCCLFKQLSIYAHFQLLSSVFRILKDVCFTV